MADIFIRNKPPVNVCAFTGGFQIPSARFRLRQMISCLESEGVNVKELVPFVSSYPPRAKILRPLWGVLALLNRLPGVISSYNYDLVFLQREMISTFSTLEKFTNHPRVLDIDDAIWLHRGGKFARELVALSDGVICGNNYISSWASLYNNKISVIPTAVDSHRFTPESGKNQRSGEFIIGWSGTSGGFNYLYRIEKALANLVKVRENIKIRIVSDRPPEFRLLPDHKVEFIKWSPKIEVQAIRGMSVGIMPLDNSEWSKGKCSFKMLTYMACGIPVVVSSVGMNTDVLSKGNCGYGVSSRQDWEDALLSLLDNEYLSSEMGGEGRKIIENCYSIEVVAPQLANFFKDIINR